jgi:hypothetical protein
MKRLSEMTDDELYTEMQRQLVPIGKPEGEKRLADQLLQIRFERDMVGRFVLNAVQINGSRHSSLLRSEKR